MNTNMHYLTLKLKDKNQQLVEHRCVVFERKLTRDAKEMIEISRGSHVAAAKFGEAELTPIQAAAAYAAARVAIVEWHTKKAALVGGIKEDKVQPVIDDALREQVDWLQTACDLLGQPTPIEKAEKMLGWMRERITVISQIG